MNSLIVLSFALFALTSALPQPKISAPRSQMEAVAKNILSKQSLGSDMKEKMPLTNIDFKSLAKDHFVQNPNEEKLAVGAAVLHLGFVTIWSGGEQYDIQAALGSVGGALVQSIESSGLKQYESKHDIHQFLAPLHQKYVKEPLSDNDGFYVSEDIAQGNSTLLAVRDGNEAFAVGIDSGILTGLRIGGGENKDITLAKVLNVYDQKIEDFIGIQQN